MKHSLLFLALSIMSVSAYSQSATSLTIPDTRSVNDAPSFANKQMRIDFKENSKIDAPLKQGFSANLTISPWNHSSGGYNHQLNFNNNGIYYRTSDYITWKKWQKLCILNADGNLQLGENYWQLDKWSGYGNKLILGGVGSEADAMWIGKYCKAYNESEFRVNIGDIVNDLDRFTIGICQADSSWINRFIVTTDGKVGINVDNPQNALDVNGTIKAKEILVTNTGWADFVFQSDYQLKSLNEVQEHIIKHKHLPDIPSAADVKANGVDLGEMNVKLLQKIEELTLYLIQQQKEINDLKTLIKK